MTPPPIFCHPASMSENRSFEILSSHVYASTAYPASFPIASARSPIASVIKMITRSSSLEKFARNGPTFLPLMCDASPMPRILSFIRCQCSISGRSFAMIAPQCDWMYFVAAPMASFIEPATSPIVAAIFGQFAFTHVTARFNDGTSDAITVPASCVMLSFIVDHRPDSVFDCFAIAPP